MVVEHPHLQGLGGYGVQLHVPLAYWHMRVCNADEKDACKKNEQESAKWILGERRTA